MKKHSNKELAEAHVFPSKLSKSEKIKEEGKFSKWLKNKRKKSNAGRKPLTDKKVRVVLFFNQSKISSHGGMELFKQFMYEWANDK